MARNRFAWLLCLVCLLAHPAHAVTGGPEAARPCAALGQQHLPKLEGAAVILGATTIVHTGRADFCQVRGTITPAIHFEVDLPLAHWSRRFLQTGCGGLCGSLRVEVNNADCPEAANGTLALASDDMGHQNPEAWQGSADFGRNPQARIDFAYRANHLTALAAKALIAAFYHTTPAKSYFMGCSDGGREALEEAERYPDDFDGIVAGAPAMNFQVQNSFYHAWMALANTGPGGHAILRAERLPILHSAVIAACDALDGDKDGLLTDPRQCHFDPATIECRPGARDATACLTAAEVAVARKFYQGPLAEDGSHLTAGGPQYGSELAWVGVYVPPPGTDLIFSKLIASSSIAGVIYPAYSPIPADLTKFPFTRANFARVSALAPLNDAGNPDIAAFLRRGGKLILYHGWSDPHISPINTIAYWQALGRFLGAPMREAGVRLYLLPGMYHCGGGDGFWQVDLLSPLLDWVEHGRAPQALLARNGTLPPFHPKGPPADGRHLLPQPFVPSTATRPIYPFPLVPRYIGSGDLTRAESFRPAPARTDIDDAANWLGAQTYYAPDFQKWYEVANGALIERPR